MRISRAQNIDNKVHTYYVPISCIQLHTEGTVELAKLGRYHLPVMEIHQSTYQSIGTPSDSSFRKYYISKLTAAQKISPYALA